MSRGLYLFSIWLLLSGHGFAQTSELAPPAGDIEVKKGEPVKTATATKTARAEKAAGDVKKSVMVQQATLNNMQMTVTGNQEQPRVLYILPWQSPATTDVDFEPLDNEQKAVFGHVEREELRRELESVGEGE